jgi:hypothetical protein
MPWLPHLADATTTWQLTEISGKTTISAGVF